MKAITLYQPWATLVVLGAKKIETRSWATEYRGPLAIHASKSFPGRLKLLMFKQPLFDALKNEPYFEMEGDLPTGCIVGTATLINCVPFPNRLEEASLVGLNYQERAFGSYRPGRFMWVLENPKRLVIRPPAKGKLRLWEWEESQHVPTMRE